MLLHLCDTQGFKLAQEFYWYNSSKLPSPIEWCNVRKIRAKDSVNTIWWLSKTDNPHADVTQVLTPYSKRMQQLLAKKEGFISANRPSGYSKSNKIVQDKGGAIPSNLLQIPNTESNNKYFHLCKQFGLPKHPARFPKQLPEFFIKLLTKPGDLVCDIFSGSNTTGFVAEGLERRWLSIEQNLDYVLGSYFRFSKKQTVEELKEDLEKLRQFYPIVI